MWGDGKISKVNNFVWRERNKYDTPDVFKFNISDKTCKQNRLDHVLWSLAGFSYIACTKIMVTTEYMYSTKHKVKGESFHSEQQ